MLGILHRNKRVFIISLSLTRWYNKNNDSLSQPILWSSCISLPGSTNTHHILGIHLSHRSSRCHGRTQSAWGYTVYSGTWTHSPHHKCCWCTLEVEKNKLRLMDTELCWECFCFLFFLFLQWQHKADSYSVTVPLTAASFNTLISSIRTVLVSIALPALRHTHVGARTLERLRTAGLGFCDNIMGKLSDGIASGNLKTFSEKSQWAWEKALSHWWVQVIYHLLHFWSSSEPSPQSSEPSHTQWEEMQRWFAHSNWVDVQNLSAEDGKESSAFRRNYLIYPNRKSCFSMCSGKQSGFSGML